ncbi:MAG: precorrin-3B C(17)-methyltransferase [Candidatus Melainabacteria bacterium]|nr:MAG: precorrin-3B C(17)-methyltransferase [Candidatus Melainabacteria bacterium]
MSEAGLFLVSIGPGFIEHLTPMAAQALQESDAVVGYSLYFEWIKPLLNGQEIYSLPLTQERERARKALDLARKGKRVSLVSSGDVGVYAMASLVFEELKEMDPIEVCVVPGITAANACASLLGAPLSHDYATLSLSDLLCPWSTIEERARHLAEADLCMVLYNVQSRTRQAGIYKIIRILLEHKSANTICGVVRNAYREGQSVSTSTLSELLQQSFDMFTTIIVGNQYTKRKRHFIYTDRGYSGNLESTVEEEIPKGAIWVFSGTSDGNELANRLVALGHTVVLSVATDYGAEMARRNCPGAYLFAGRIGWEARRNSLRNSSAAAIVDATHPYSVSMSEQLIELSQALNVPYLRFDRPSCLDERDVELCHTIEEATTRAIELGKRIFLATGSKDLSEFLKIAGATERMWFARVTPDNQSIAQAVAAGIPRNRICAMQGPFSQAFNESLWKEWQIDCLVTKDSGTAGGYEAKIGAARKLGIPILVIKRPVVQYPRVAYDFQSVANYLSPNGVAV